MTTESAPGNQNVTQKCSKIHKIDDSGPFNHQFTQHLQRVVLGNLPLAGAVAEDEFGVLRRAPPFLFRTRADLAFQTLVRQGDPELHHVCVEVFPG